MKILGLGSPFQHDPSAALVIDGEIVAAAEEERFNRRKHAVRDLAVNSTRYCLESAGVRPEEVDIVAFPWSPETFARLENPPAPLGQGGLCPAGRPRCRHLAGRGDFRRHRVG